jgi:hypothetical protein
VKEAVAPLQNFCPKPLVGTDSACKNAPEDAGFDRHRG